MGDAAVASAADLINFRRVMVKTLTQITQICTNLHEFARVDFLDKMGSKLIVRSNETGIAYYRHIQEFNQPLVCVPLLTRFIWLTNHQNRIVPRATPRALATRAPSSTLAAWQTAIGRVKLSP
jgi:hypothetical protein